MTGLLSRGRVLWPMLMMLAACGRPHQLDRNSERARQRALAERFPLTNVAPVERCAQLLSRTAESAAVWTSPPSARRMIAVSDLHLAAGHVTRGGLAGIEDFFSDDAFAAMLDDQAARGPTDLVIAGDFLEFWQVVAGLRRDGVLPARDASSADVHGGATEAEAQTALAVIVAAHPTVFASLGRWLDAGDNRVILLPGNHDAELAWPWVQRDLAAATRAVNLDRLMFVDAAAAQIGRVWFEHGHQRDGANAFARGHAPFVQQAQGCALESNWGDVFVDAFYSDVERKWPFIDNLIPESAGIAWAFAESPERATQAHAVLGFLRLLTQVQPGEFNVRTAMGAMRGVVGLPANAGTGAGAAASTADQVTDQLIDQLLASDTALPNVGAVLVDLALDPDLAPLWASFVDVGRALPDLTDTLRAVARVDRDGLRALHTRLFAPSATTTARQIADARPDADTVVFAHTHVPGGRIERDTGTGRPIWIVNTGTWTPTGDVAALRQRAVAWSHLAVTDAALFPTHAPVVEFERVGDGLAAPTLRVGPWR